MCKLVRVIKEEGEKMNSKSILVFGTGKGCEFFISILNDIDIIEAFIDSDYKKKGAKFYGKCIINPQEIYKYNYDYIIIASQFYFEIKALLLNLSIPSEKIIEFYRILPIKIEERFNLQKNISSFINEDYEVIVTGISYALRGINENKFNYNIINLAMSGQDLFCDYNIVKSLFQIKPKNKIKKVILGISYYSFQYDLSQSSSNYRALIYYKFLNNLHNYNHDIGFIESFKNYNIIEDIFEDNYLLKVLHHEKCYGLLNRLLDGNLDSNSKDLGKQLACKHSKKNYPKTYKENILILKNYIKFLNDNNVEVNLVVFPTTKYYYEYFSQSLVNEFYEAILEIKKKHSFQIYDFFSSKLFSDEDFYDVTHLNKNGANKISRLINYLI